MGGLEMKIEQALKIAGRARVRRYIPGAEAPSPSPPPERSASLSVHPPHLPCAMPVVVSRRVGPVVLGDRKGKVEAVMISGKLLLAICFTSGDTMASTCYSNFAKRTRPRKWQSHF